MFLQGFRFGMLLQIAVGPVCLFIFKTAAAVGIFEAITGVAGVTIIDAAYLLAAIWGMGAFLEKYQNVKVGLHYFGAAVLIIFGLSNLLGAFQIPFLPSLDLAASQDTNHILFQAILLTLANPLTILFWTGVFSTKMTEKNFGEKELYLFSSGALLSTLFFLTMIAILGSVVPVFLNEDIIMVFNILVGIVLIFFGVKAAMKKV